MHSSVREAQVTDVCTGHQTGFIVKSNWQEQGRKLVNTLLFHIICCIELCAYLQYKLSIIHQDVCRVMVCV